jgi:glycosyltransferase involved in cell wall biosynthesis
MPATVLFYRAFARFAGHHLKVWDYFNHVLASPHHTALMRFWSESRLDDTNPWCAIPEHVVDRATPVDPDVYFLSGMDWTQINAGKRRRSPQPVINLVLHPTHLRPENPRYAFLSNRAIRICVCPEMAEGVAATGRLDGPLFVIPCGIDVEAVTAVAAGGRQRDIDVLVAGLKNPEMGRAVAARLAGGGRAIHLIDRHLTQRTELLELLARSRVTVFLPWHEEGFYMPALEGMALGTVVVCPDVFGNRSFCLHETNCFCPRYDEDALVASAEAALEDLPNLDRMLANAFETAHEHDLMQERQAFLAILERLDELWDE